MIMPSHAKNVKHYNSAMPLFARYQVEGYLAGMFNPTVQLKSGGYIVIGITEALVAIDVNSGRSTKEGSIEDTALKTNLEASDEVARQLRLRDLAGLIVIDYIDMDERRNNTAVEKRLKDRLKNDRARIQVGRISGFGLMEMSRQRLRPGMIETTTQPCAHCHGTGLIRSDENLALSILRQLEEEGTRRRSREVLLKAPVGIVNYLVNNKREHIARIEQLYGLSVRIEADPFLVSPDFSIEKFKTASRVVKAKQAVVSVDTSAIMAGIDEAVEQEDAPAVETSDEDTNAPKKRRRRRRRRRGGRSGEDAGQDAGQDQNDENATADTSADKPEVKEADQAADQPAEKAAEVSEAAEPVQEEKPKRKRAPRKRKTAAEKVADATDTAEVADVKAEVADAKTEDAPKKKPTRRRKPATAAKDKAEESPAKAVEADKAVEVVAEENPAPKKRVRRKPAVKKDAVEKPAAEPKAKKEPKPKKAPAAKADPAPEPKAAEPQAVEKPARAKPEPKPDTKSDTPKKKGWWSLGR